MSEVFLDSRVLDYAEGWTNNIWIDKVAGILKEPLQISVESNWENIFNIGGSLADNVAKFSSLAGNPVGLLNTGIWSRKFYKGGSYLKINPKMRVVNWNGDNNVIDDARRLTDLALPLYKGKSLDELANDFININIREKAKQAGGEVVDVFTNPKKVVSDFKGLLNKFASNSPRPVDVTISNFFKNTFIVESVQVEFSKEMTSQGPLYADFDVVLSTPEVTLRGGTGLKNVSRRFSQS